MRHSHNNAEPILEAFRQMLGDSRCATIEKMAISRARFSTKCLHQLRSIHSPLEVNPVQSPQPYKWRPVRHNQVCGVQYLAKVRVFLSFGTAMHTDERDKASLLASADPDFH